MDYVFVARNKQGDGFGNEPGASHFVAVPEHENDISYAHKIKKGDWVRAVLDAAKGGTTNPNTEGDIVFYVHGFNMSQAEVLERHRKIRKGLEAQGFDGVVVTFDWPSANSALNYQEDRVDAKLSAFRLVSDGISTFAALQAPDCKIDLHIIAHSTGCYVVREAFDDADDRAAIAGVSWSVSQVILLSADLSVGSLMPGSSKSSSLYRHSVRLTNYYNPLDDVLSISAVKRIGVAPRAGRQGLSQPHHEDAVNIYCGKHYFERRGRYGGGVSEGHRFYFDDACVMEDMYHTICGQLDRHEIPTRGMTDQGNLALVARSDG